MSKFRVSIEKFRDYLSNWEEEKNWTAMFFMVLLASRAKAFWLAKKESSPSSEEIDLLQGTERRLEIILRHNMAQVTEEFAWIDRRYNAKYYMDQLAQLPDRMHKLREASLNLKTYQLEVKKTRKLWELWVMLSWMSENLPPLLAEQEVFLRWREQFNAVDELFLSKQQEIFSPENRRDFFNSLCERECSPPFWWLNIK